MFILVYPGFSVSFLAILQPPETSSLRSGSGSDDGWETVFDILQGVSFSLFISSIIASADGFTQRSLSSTEYSFHRGDGTFEFIIPITDWLETPLKEILSKLRTYLWFEWSGQAREIQLFPFLFLTWSADFSNKWRAEWMKGVCIIK